MAGFGPAITATIGADVGPLNAAGPRVESAAGNIATKMERRLLGSAHVSQALATSFGLNIEKMANFVAGLVFGVTERAKKAWEELGESGVRVLEILEAQFAARRGDSQAAAAAEEKLNSLKRQAVELLKQQADWNSRIDKLQANSATAKYFAVSLLNAAEEARTNIQNKLAANQAEQQKVAAVFDTLAVKAQQELGRLEQTRFEKSIKSLPLQQQIVELTIREQTLGAAILTFKGKGVDLDLLKKQLAETTAAIEDARQKRREEGDKRALEIDQESFEYEKAHHEQLVLEAKLKTGTILPAERERLNVIRLQVKEAGLQREMAMLLEKPLKDWTQQDKERFAVLQQQTKEIEKQIGLITNPPLPPNPPIIEQIKGYIEAWEGFVVKVTSSGRGDKELSDRELARKAKNIRQDIFVSDVNRINRIGVGNEGGFDPFGYINQSNLAGVQAEQRLRADVRRANSSFGEEKAFSMFNLTESRFREIIQGGLDQSQKLERTLDNLERGIQGLNENLKTRPRI